MPTLASQTAQVSATFSRTAPQPIQDVITTNLQNHISTFDTSSVLKPGSILPPFTLPNATGQIISSADLLAKGPILVTFYRGHWCPFCSLALRSLQQILPTLHERGVQLVAISPELPDTSLSTSEKNALTFPVLSDVENAYARELGLVWKMDDSLRPIFEKLGHDLVKGNGDDSFEVPVPATVLVGGDGVVRKRFVEADYRVRVEPGVVLEWVDEL
ncbi:thioredoxin-like protein [Lophiotrema nucula]|uniref:thioredoxin-dependent peroxiredoxin n=1 Tax=Lophiotrema nucula TaxID=690887 RepID=A0A6A5YUS6_9PLEO|nr:thioredoxin-like protein [Lophiotrema nucula]